MADGFQRTVIADLSGGRNGVDAPTSPRFRANQVSDAVNMDWYQTTFGRKRNGSSASDVSFSSGGPFTGHLSFLCRHVPGTDPTAAEEWAIDDAGVVGRKAGATSFSAPTLIDAITGNAWDIESVSFDGKWCVAYKSSQARFHCWDTSTVRRAGINPGGAGPSLADSAGAGTYPATTIYCRVRYTKQSGGVTVLRSEPTPVTTFTPSGTKAGVAITRPTPPGEGETHWEIELSTDNASFYVLYGDITGANAAIAIATTAQGLLDDPTTFSTFGVPDAVGMYSLHKSYIHVAADQNRLLGFGSYTSSDPQNRVWIGAVLGSRDVGDAERLDTTGIYYYDLDEKDSGIPMGLAGPVFGNFYAFKDRQVWELAATGSTSAPYSQRALSKEIGLVSPKAVARGDDALGNAALYWLSHRGFYRYGVMGLEYIGLGVEDLILGPTSTINLAASKVVAHMVYHPDKWQIWCWFATGSSNDPDTLVIYDVRTGGWSRFTGTGIAGARCSAMLPKTLAASMSRDLLPYIGLSGTANKITQCDDASATDDSGTTFQAYLDLKPIEPGGPGFYGTVGDALLLAKAATGVTITAGVKPDFASTYQKTGTALLTATGTETRVVRRLEDSNLTGASFVQYRLGDGSAVSNAWSLDRLVIPYQQDEPVSA